MSKRIGFQYRQPKSKMPRLDITISSSQRTTVGGPSNMNQQQKVAEVPANTEDAWFEDEEDEIFVLASQSVEQVQANAAVVISQAMNTDHDMSYGRFRKDVRAVHSTQLESVDMFTDKYEDLFSEVIDIFAEPTQSNAVPAIDNKENTVSQSAFIGSQVIVPVPSDHKFRDKKEKIQTEFYTEKIKMQKKQIETLRESLSTANQKCMTKEGEASTLRYEVSSKTREIERIRKERMDEAVDMEKKFAEKITALERKIEIQRSELDFRNMEIMQKKSRKSVNDSISIELEDGFSNFQLYYLFKLHTTHFAVEDLMRSSAAEFITRKCFETHRGLSERDFDPLNNLNILQSIYNGAKAMKLRALDNKMKEEFTDITHTFITELREYTSRLTQRTPTKYNPGTESKILSERLAKAAIYDEKLVFETQMVAVIALLCTDFLNTTPILLFEKCESSTNADNDELGDDNRIGSFVDILTDALCTIGHSNTLSLHKSLIESASLLLVALAKSFSHTDLSDLLLLNLFQAIVFCEPDLQSLKHLSEFLCIISLNQSSNICNRLCCNETNNMTTYQRYKTHRFSIDTCPLQIFSCLLQSAFEPYTKSSVKSQQSSKVNIVANITIRMMKFLRYCYCRRVDWLFIMTRHDGVQHVSHCYCYFVSCIVVLLHFCANNWIEIHKSIDLKLLKTFSNMSTLFIYDIIKKHYMPKVLSSGGFTVKNRLQAIYDWITSYDLLFRISSTSRNALKAVNLRRISQLNEPQMVSTDDTNEVDSILLASFDEVII